jgi:ABC-type thiamin/hydroxymethylpyrimidine transport system permease subunit
MIPYLRHRLTRYILAFLGAGLVFVNIKFRKWWLLVAFLVVMGVIIVSFLLDAFHPVS